MTKEKLPRQYLHRFRREFLTNKHEISAYLRYGSWLSIKKNGKFVSILQPSRVELPFQLRKNQENDNSSTRFLIQTKKPYEERMAEGWNFVRKYLSNKVIQKIAGRDIGAVKLNRETFFWHHQDSKEQSRKHSPDQIRSNSSLS